MTAPPSPAAHRAPLAHLRAATLLAAASAVIALAVVALGGGGLRWTAVHLFTLGSATILVATLSHHFAATLLHAAEDRFAGRRLTLLTLGVTVLLSSQLRIRPLVVLGATLSAAGVLWVWWDVRGMRRRALTPGRFAFVVRAYQRGAGAFVHGALLGTLMGTGVFSGRWYTTARLAHIHVQVLGWVGISLLATIVFFGPTVLRRRMTQGADARAARGIRVGATGVTVGVLALLASALPGSAGTALRLMAAGSFAAYAWGVGEVCLPLLRTPGRRAQASGLQLLAAATWFVALAWADVIVVATGSWQWLDVIGVAFGVGVLLQALLGASGGLVPMMFGRDAEARDHMRSSMERGAIVRVAVVNSAALAAAAGAAGLATGTVAWLLVTTALAVQVALAVHGRTRR